MIVFSSCLQVESYDDMKAALQAAEGPGIPGAGMFLVPWRDDADAENAIKVSAACRENMRWPCASTYAEA